MNLLLSEFTIVPYMIDTEFINEVRYWKHFSISIQRIPVQLYVPSLETAWKYSPSNPRTNEINRSFFR